MKIAFFVSLVLLFLSGVAFPLDLCRITYEESQDEASAVVARIQLPDESLDYRVNSSPQMVTIEILDFSGIIVSDKDRIEGFIDNISLLEKREESGERVILFELSKSYLSLIEKHGTSIKLKFSKSNAFSKIPELPFYTERKYMIGIDDKLSFSVYNNPDLSKTTQVGKDGNVNFPLLGDIQAAGLSVSELTDQVTQLLEKDYIVKPQVSIEVIEYNSQWAYVTGEVRNQMRISLKGNTTLKDAIAEAGGLSSFAGPDIIISRKKEGSEESEHMRIDTTDFEEGIANALLIHGDVITVPKAKYAYIQGEVSRSCEIRLEKGLTLLKAISIAQGLTDWADDSVIILRESNGNQVSEKYNLKKIREGKAPDVPLKPGDVIIVKKRFL